MTTYAQIQDDVRACHNRTVKTCWIAHVKALNGLNPRTAPNRQSSESRVYPCPDDARQWIEESMRRLGML
ncbi:MAG: hypothetical protein HHJ09_12750 [Glaciimonas sp.]|nr:hypothetical protein [Glaciimonas sp.]